MDADGNVVAKQGERTVAGFRSTLDALTRYQDLKERMAKGEKGLEFPIFVAEWDLGMLDFEKAKGRAEAMGKLTDEQKVQAKQIVQDAEVLDLAGKARSEEAANAAGQRFHEMLEKGYRLARRLSGPTGGCSPVGPT